MVGSDVLAAQLFVPAVPQQDWTDSSTVAVVKELDYSIRPSKILSYNALLNLVLLDYWPISIIG